VTAPQPPNREAGFQPFKRLALLFNSVPTTAKLIIALSMALLPMGILSLLAAIDNYQFARDRLSQDAQSRLQLLGNDITAAIERDYVALRAAAGALPPNASRASCEAFLERLVANNPALVQISIVNARGRNLCNVGMGLRPRPTADDLKLLVLAETPPLIRVDTLSSSLQLMIRGDRGQSIIGTIPAIYLQGLASQHDTRGLYDFAILTGDRTLALDPQRLSGMSTRRTYALPGTGGVLTATFPDARLRAGEVLTAMLPFLMWVAALLVSWLVVHRLFARPLGRMRRAVRLYAEGHREIRLRPIVPDSVEVASLAQAFDDMAEGAERHEQEMVAGLERQRQLVREVHHRVKNNLQVIASLLSIQARRADSPDIALAYAAIQRRVDALALAHRHHYAEEEASGIRLDSLLRELLPSLKGHDGNSLALSLNTAEVRVNQDVAIAVAFILAEMLSEMALQPQTAPIAIHLLPGAEGSAILQIMSDDFKGVDRFSTAAEGDVARIVQGMARKMRATLAHDPVEGRYDLAIPLMARAATSG
jgi:two-component sensor histidine kinase